MNKLFNADLSHTESMGELSRFKGITVDIHWFDTNKHKKPHVHANYAESEVTIAIDGEVLDGGIPAKQLKLLKAWLILNEDELYDAWNKAVQGINPGKIG